MVTLDFINVGYGDAILIRDTAASFTMLVDCGDVRVGDVGPDSRRISAADYLRREGIETLDLLVLTHLHRDHSGGLAELLSHITIKEFWTNYLPPESVWGSCVDVPEGFSAGSRCLLESLNIYLNALETMKNQGTCIRLRDEHQADCRLTGNLSAELHTESGGFLERQAEIWSQVLEGRASDPILQELDAFINNTSLRLCLYCGGQRIELPGDVYAACWETHSIPPCSILKLPHHGHKDSLTPRLLEMLHPAHAVISVSNSRTDACPHPEIVQLLHQAGAQVYFTDAVSSDDRPVLYHTALRFQISPQGGIITKEIV